MCWGFFADFCSHCQEQQVYSFGVATLCSARQDFFCSNKLYGSAKLSREINIHKTHLLLSCTWPSCSQVNDNSRKSGLWHPPCGGSWLLSTAFPSQPQNFWCFLSISCSCLPVVLPCHSMFLKSANRNYTDINEQLFWPRTHNSVICSCFFSVFSPFMRGPDSKDLIVIFYCFVPALLKQVVSQPCSAMTVMLFPSDSCNNKVL